MEHHVAVVSLFVLLLPALSAHAAYRDAVLADSPVAYWEFADAGAADGAVAADTVGGQDGSYSGNVSLVAAGIGGHAAQFNGATAGVDLGYGLRAVLDGAPAVTVEAWMRNASLPNAADSRQWIVATRIADAWAGVDFGLAYDEAAAPPDETFVRMAGRSTSPPADGYQRENAVFVGTDRWHHVVGINDYSNRRIRIYIDGVLVRDEAAAFNSSAYDPGSTESERDQIGRGGGGAAGHFHGVLDEIAIYGYALSASQVANHFAAGVPVDPPESATLWLSQVAFSDAATGIYLGSPSIARLDSNTLIVCHDYFGPNAPMNAGGWLNSSAIHRSLDNGQTWSHVTDFTGSFWPTVFEYEGDVYVISESARYESIVLRKSTDGGLTWSEPTNAVSGLLRQGGSGFTQPNYFSGNNNMLIADGKIYRSFCDRTTLTWADGYETFVLWAELTNDLLRADSWHASTRVAFPAGTFAIANNVVPGWQEGSVVQAPNGDICNVMRVNVGRPEDRDTAAILRLSADGVTLSFDPDTGFVSLPGASAGNFMIRRDPKTGLYVTLVNNIVNPEILRQRNYLSLAASEDLLTWRLVKTVLADDQGLSAEDSAAQTGFQYVHWHFDGDALMYIVRTAYDDAHDYHDSNRITYHRLSDYADVLRTAFPAAFDPTDVPNCALWLRADAGSVVTNAVGAVSAWFDASGSGNHASQAATPYQPLLVPDAMNGHAAVRFDGTDDFFTVAHTAELNAGQGFTVFFVCRRTDGFRMMQKGDGSGAGAGSESAWFVSPAPVMGVAGTWNAGVAYSPGWGIMECRFDETVGAYGMIRTYTNGVSTPVATNLITAYVNGTDTLYLGKRNWPGQTEGHFAGELAEVIIYNDSLSEAHRQQVGAYLSERYAISSAYAYEPPGPYQGPAGVSNCVLWLVAEPEHVVTNAGGRVSEWRDKTGRHNHVQQAMSAYQPLFVTHAIGGWAAVRFDGSNDFVTATHSGDLDGLEGLTVFAVYTHTGSPSNSFRLLQKGAGLGVLAGDWFVSPSMSMGVAGTWNAAAPTTNTVLGQCMYDPATLENGAIWSYVGGRRHGGGAYVEQSFSGNYDDLYVGKRDNQGLDEGHFHGDLVELLIFDRPLSDAEQRTVGNYLTDRYGLQPGYAHFRADPFGPPWISQVAFSPASTDIYLGSPAIHILTNREYIVSYDLFGNGAPKNAHGMYDTSVLAWSTNAGSSWQAHTRDTGFFWSSFFALSNTLYRMGASARFEHIAIASSSDGGRSWSGPVTLVSGGSGTTAPNYTCGPVPVAFANGRVYRAMENMEPLVWAQGMRALVMSAPLNSDLLDPASWTKSNELPFDPDWLDGVGGIHTPSQYGYLEGNVVVAPDGSVKDILASNRRSSYDKAVMLDVSPDGTTVSFDRYIDLPGGGSKFTIRRDPVTGLYLTMGTRITDRDYVDQRNVLSLSASKNLVDWILIKDLVTDNQPISWEVSVAKTGFQYADWQFEGADIIYLVRTAYFGADNYHDSNRITFHRLDNYVALLNAALSKGTIVIVR